MLAERCRDVRVALGLAQLGMAENLLDDADTECPARAGASRLRAADAVFAVYLVGAVTNKVSISVDLWVITGLRVWIGSLLFAAFGLFIGHLLPIENITQISTPARRSDS